MLHHLLDVSTGKGKAGITLNWTLKKNQTQILNTFYCYVITVSPNVNVHFSLIKLNSSAHLCQNNLSSFSLIPKMFWMVTRVTDERTFPVLFWVCGLNAVPPMWCKCVHQGRFVLRESHVWKQEDTAATVSVRIYYLETKPHVSVWKKPIRDPSSSFLQGQAAALLWSLIYILSFFFLLQQSPLAGRESSVSLGRKKDIVSVKLKVTTDPTDVTLTTLLDIVLCFFTQYDKFSCFCSLI